MNTRKRICPKNYSLSEYPEFSDRLKLVMKLRNYTSGKLAARIFTSRATISMYLSGRRMPTISILCLISKELEVSTDFLLGLSEIVYV